MLLTPSIGLQLFMGTGRSKYRRLSTIRGDISPQDKVVEIGALCNPIVSRSDAQVFYIDYAETDYLKKRYRNDPNVKVEEIIEVDGVWGDKDLKTCLNGFAPVDLVIASHVIEHVPDLITWLQEVESILGPSGVLSLAIPDMRFTFDHLRRLTEFSDLLESHLLKRRCPSTLNILDFSINFSLVSAKDAWRGRKPSQIDLSMERLDQIQRQTLENFHSGEYQDVHVSVFTPLRFAELMKTLVELDFVRYRCASFIDTRLGGMEFFVRMQRCQEKQEALNSWLNVCRRLSSIFSKLKLIPTHISSLVR